MKNPTKSDVETSRKITVFVTSLFLGVAKSAFLAPVIFFYMFFVAVVAITLQTTPLSFISFAIWRIFSLLITGKLLNEFKLETNDILNIGFRAILIFSFIISFGKLFIRKRLKQRTLRQRLLTSSMVIAPIWVLTAIMVSFNTSKETIPGMLLVMVLFCLGHLVSNLLYLTVDSFADKFVSLLENKPA